MKSDLHYIRLQCIWLDSIALGQIPPISTTLDYIRWHDVTLYVITFHYIPYITLRYITLHYVTLHYITLRYITLHYVTLHYITLETLHCIDLHLSEHSWSISSCISVRVGMQSVVTDENQAGWTQRGLSPSGGGHRST